MGDGAIQTLTAEKARNFGSDVQTMQTPIEIALGVDENGKTTAKKLYTFLELNPAHYARCVKQISLKMNLQQKMRIMSHSPLMVNAGDKPHRISS